MQTACIWRGRVDDLAQELHRPEFFAGCAERFKASKGKPVQESEYRSWRHSWPALVKVLQRAGLGRMQIYLEYATAGDAGRMDALLLGRTRHGVPALVVVELKQWTRFKVLSALQVLRSDGEQVSHPVAQVAGYLAYLRQWFEAGQRPVVVRGLVFLHNATTAQAQELRTDQEEIPVLSGEDLAVHLPPATLLERLLCADLQAPDEQQVTAFEHARWRPSRRLLDSIADMLEEKQTFTLTGDQQEAFLRILHTARQAIERQHRRAVIMVTGGPGSGKTVIAVRVLARLLRTGLDVRYSSPSGTLIKQLNRAAGEQAGKDLFLNPGSLPGQAAQGCRIAILDEAQRLPKLNDDRGLLREIIGRFTVVVLFLDKRQIIRPNEGITVEEVRRLAAICDAKLEHLTLNGCFRSNASRVYAQWVDDLLYGAPRPWSGGDFDLDVVQDPVQLQEWIDHHTIAGATARIAAGFCWPWKRHKTRLLPEVCIHWTDSAGRKRSWQAPWNAEKEIGCPPVAPHHKYWATDPGGHRQVGCIYTAQGLEYDYGGVIIGPDLIRRDGSWHAQPQYSHDPKMKNINSKDYLPLTLNTYRVLLTRSLHGTRIYSTDLETQKFIESLVSKTRTFQ